MYVPAGRLIDRIQARTMGFLGHVDSTADFIETFKLCEQLKLLPKHK